MEDNHLTVSDALIPPENDHDAGAKISKSVNELNDLSISIQTFKNKYDELQNHLNFIEQAIETRTKELEALTTTTTAQIATENGDIVQSEPELKSNTEVEEEEEEEPEEEDPEEEEEPEEEQPPPPQQPPPQQHEEKGKENELLSLCKTMNSRGLRRYILSHLSETTSLKKQIPNALKTAREPSKLVFECIGRFYLQGRKAYTPNSPMIKARQASVLVLEYYLISGCVVSEANLEPSLKEEAASAAVSWRKRLISEGGVSTASEMDARGLILFLACFGVPGVFRNEDVVNLVRLSKPGEVSDILRHSQDLYRRALDIAEEMMKKGMVVEAVDLAYTFDFKGKFPPNRELVSFLKKSNEAWRKAKQEADDNPSLLKKANLKYLTALKSVINCLEDHKVDCAKLLPGWSLNVTISNLEKNNVDLTKKIEENSESKRKLDKISTSKKVNGPDTKRTRYSVRDPFVVSPSVTTTLQGQRIASHLDSNSSYDGSLTAHYLEGRSYGYPNNYSTVASPKIGSGSRAFPEGLLGRGVSSGGSMIGGAIAGSLSGYQSDVLVDNVGTPLNSNSSLYSRLHRMDEGSLPYNRSVEQSFVEQPSSTQINHLYGRTYAEDYAGLPDHQSIGVPSRAGGSDLYSFADSVFDM